VRGDEDQQLQREETEMKRLSIKVDGITCSGCAVDVESVLKNADGVSDAEASYAAGTVSVDYHPDEINEKQVLDLVKKLGLKIA
jgi:Cu+-exporting ATPase